MPVWIEPKGTRLNKLTAFVVYLRAMQERCNYVATETSDELFGERSLARAEVYGLVAKQLEGLL